MHNQQDGKRRRQLAFTLLAGAVTLVAGCSGGSVVKSSPVARTLHLPAEWRLRSEERKLRKAVEADQFPLANERGL
jgi:hypothetical protein